MEIRRTDKFGHTVRCMFPLENSGMCKARWKLCLTHKGQRPAGTRSLSPGGIRCNMENLSNVKHGLFTNFSIESRNVRNELLSLHDKSFPRVRRIHVHGFRLTKPRRSNLEGKKITFKIVSFRSRNIWSEITRFVSYFSRTIENNGGIRDRGVHTLIQIFRKMTLKNISHFDYDKNSIQTIFSSTFFYRRKPSYLDRAWRVP